MARKTTTREPKFNSYIDNSDDCIRSVADVSATKINPNIKLMEYNAPILKTGLDINKYSEENDSYKYFERKGTAIVSGLDNLQNCYIFASPMKTVLDNLQQYNNCGADSILNILAIAGMKTITNQNKVETAFTKELWNLGLVDDSGKMGVFDFYDGGIDSAVFKEIFDFYGVNSNEYFGKGDTPTVDVLTMTKYVREGGSAIVGVSSELLWHSNDPEEENISIDHVVTVTGVVYGTKNPTDETVPTGFFIHDTGGWMSRYISYDEFLKVTLEGKLEVEGVVKDGIFSIVVTDNIHKNLNDTNATGTDEKNVIYGNSGNNIIKGVGGDDSLVGAAGNDTIYGGSGNDIIYGNGVIKNEEYLSLIEAVDIKNRINSLKYVSTKEEDAFLVGRNFIYGGNGNDYIFGGEYNDTIEAGAGDDFVVGGAGIDAIRGGSGKDKLYGGDGNDKIYGDSGDDYIDGGSGDDMIIGGSGNDTIIGGSGQDHIECGAGKDTVVFESGCDIDYVKSKSGSSTLEFKDNSISGLKISLEDESSKSKNLKILFNDSKDGVVFEGFYNSNKNSSKKVYVLDEDEDSYRVTATKSRGKIKVANIKGNNILIATSKKNKTVTTGSGNDIIYLNEGNDTINYTSGKDYYYSNQGDNTYNVINFNKESFLSINDCTDIIGKTDSEGQPLAPSLNDVLNLKNSSSDELAIFFDIAKTGVINNKSLYIIDKNEITVTSDYLADVLDNSAKGVIYIEDYFVKANPKTSKYVGFGCIESIKASDGELDMDTSIKQITSEVVSWLSEKSYTSVSDAIEKSADISELIQIYTSQVLS